MLLQYLTIKDYGEHEIVIQKSRFICYVSRATTEEEAQEFIQKIKKQNWNATHNCSAYLIGEQDQIQKANDDGEPSGTAGVPMLEVLKKTRFKRYRRCRYPLFWWHQTGRWWINSRIWKMYKRRH